MLMVLTVPLLTSPPPKAKLSERYERWLNEEVVYITTPVERDVFLKLQTDKERDIFIDSFWKHRDPAPGSRENEFKKEHYRRITYANGHYGYDSPMPGWKTDRGHIYILLGEPQEVKSYSGSGLFDCESWFYLSKPEQGLPAGFYLLFFKQRGLGGFKLYSPTQDGPQALLSYYQGNPTDFQGAYKELADLNAGLADIAMSLVPGESANISGRPALTSDMLIQRIQTLPQHTVQDRYARRFLEYKDIIEVEYSANYVESDSLIKVFQEMPGLYFVHYAMEPQRLSVDRGAKKVYTTLQVNGRVTTLEGRLVHQYDKTISIEVPEDRVNEIVQGAFDLCDAFPLVPGDFKMSVIVKNELSKEFMSFTQAIRVPQGGPAIQLTQPALGYNAVRAEDSSKNISPFRMGPYQLYCQPGRVFTSKDTLFMAFQLNGLSEGDVRTGQIKISFLKDDQPFREIARKPSDYPDFPNVLERIPLADFPAAHYKVKISFLNERINPLEASEEFDLTFAPAVRRPWYSSRLLPGPADPVYSRIVGDQLFNMGRYEEALLFQERVHAARPNSPEISLGLARVYMALAKYQQAIQVLTPFVGRPEGAPYGIYILAGSAYFKSDELEKAIEVLDQAITLYGVNATILNAIGECYEKMGKTPEAIASFEKSLKLSPDQQAVQKRVEALKQKK
jgi:GWxTD domain-containing protein